MYTRAWKEVKKKLAFTLVEVIIVIFVFWVGILSIVLLLTRNLSLTRDIHIRNTATLLAREGIELTYNIRSTNHLLGYPWNCAEKADDRNITEENKWCDIYFRTGTNTPHNFTIEGITPSYSQVNIKQIDEGNLRENSRLYLTWWSNNNINFSWYTHISWEETWFYRYISFTWLSDIPNNSEIKPWDIHHISSHVLFTHWYQTGEVILESFIADIK